MTILGFLNSVIEPMRMEHMEFGRQAGRGTEDLGGREGCIPWVSEGHVWNGGRVPVHGIRVDAGSSSRCVSAVGLAAFVADAPDGSVREPPRDTRPRSSAVGRQRVGGEPEQA